MSDVIDNELNPQDELSALKTRADMMGISYHPSIGLEKLREKVNSALAPKQEEKPVQTSVGETESQRQRRLFNEAAELIRIRLTCMNPAKKEWDGEIISVGNSVVGTFTKYIPFNAEEGWHVPRLILNYLQERQCQIFTTITDSRGNKTRKGKLIREFNIEILPKLTQEELQDLAQRQAMSNSVG